MSLKMEFRHWIAIEISASLPIPGRLHPSHYSLLYYSKGKPKTFRRFRTPIQICRHYGGEVKDYGGHRGAMNPKGVNLKDVWTDVPPVRHWKFKSKDRRANALSTKILDRVIEMSTLPGDVVLDPFGGSGTTFAVCEKKRPVLDRNRDRFRSGDYRPFGKWRNPPPPQRGRYRRLADRAPGRHLRYFLDSRAFGVMFENDDLQNAGRARH
jgi:hypothetical protein